MDIYNQCFVGNKKIHGCAPYQDNEDNFDNLGMKIEDVNVTEQFQDENGLHDREEYTVKREYDHMSGLSQLKDKGKTLCRICLREGASIPLNTTLENSSASYYELIKSLIFAEISQVGYYPCNICLQCTELLKNLHNLKTTLLETEEKLKNGQNILLKNVDDRQLNLECGINQCSEVQDPSAGSPSISKGTEPQEVLKEGTFFSCSYCSKKFRRSQHLTVHKRIHTGEQPFSCSKCPKKFIQKAALDQHTRIHSGEKPFMCFICGKSFSQAISLTYHLRIHTKEKPFECSLCKKRFIQKNNLNIHMRFHRNEKPYQCELCERKFFTNSHLKVHVKQHLGKKDHGCIICNKKFFRSEHLKQHVISHKGEKPHSCNLCAKAFSQKSHLNRHMKIHQQKNPIADKNIITFKRV